MSLPNKSSNVSDLETGFSQINLSGEINTSQRDRNIALLQARVAQKKRTNLCLICFIIVFVLIFGLPLIICDLYYGYNDDTCVSNDANKLSINLRDYLLVSGYSSLVILIFLFMTLFSALCDKDLFGCCAILTQIITWPFGLFGIAWHIIGGVIFWAYMDNSTCSGNVFSYVTASLIIKYVSIGIELLRRKNEKEE